MMTGVCGRFLPRLGASIALLLEKLATSMGCWRRCVTIFVVVWEFGQACLLVCCSAHMLYFWRRIDGIAEWAAAS